jgi:circadian clock protein KaiB
MKKSGNSTKSSANSTAQKLGHAAASKSGLAYVLRLYVTGNTPRSARAIVNLRRFCETYLKGRYDLEIVDIIENPAEASAGQIIAAPTLVKQFPLPARRFIGDMSSTERMLSGFGLEPVAATPSA